MPTTTIRIDESLKVRIAAAAKRAGKTPHGFIVDTIAATVEHDETEDACDRLAEERWADFLTTGESVGWDEVKTWLEAQARGESPDWPRSRRLTR